MKPTTILLTTLPLLALAKTDLEGCTSSETIVYGGASLIYWDPSNGEICSFLDCGGGRAPPKTTVPGCAAYEGTATYSPDYMPGWGSATATAAASAVSAAESSEGVVGSVTGGLGQGSATVEASTLVTSKATLGGVSASVSAKGTGGLNVASSVVGGGNNVTGTATPSASAPAGTGGAGRFGVAQGVVGVMAGVFGLAML